MIYGRDVARHGALENWGVVLVLGIVDVLANLGDGRTCTFLALPLAATRGVQCGSLLLGLQSSGELAVDEAVVHDAAGRPMNGIGPTPDARCVFFIHENGARSEHFCSLLVMWSAADVAETSLQSSFDDGHGVLCGVEETVPGGLESRLGLDYGSSDLMPLGRGGPSRCDVGSGDGVVAGRKAYGSGLLGADVGIDGVVEDGSIGVGLSTGGLGPLPGICVSVSFHLRGPGKRHVVPE